MKIFEIEYNKDKKENKEVIKMATKSFTRNITIEDEKAISNLKAVLSSESSTNLKTSIKDIKKTENNTKKRVVKSILEKY